MAKLKSREAELSQRVSTRNKKLLTGPLLVAKSLYSYFFTLREAAEKAASGEKDKTKAEKVENVESLKSPPAPPPAFQTPHSHVFTVFIHSTRFSRF